MDNQSRIAQIKSFIEESLIPTQLTIEDESHLHAGHAGAKSGMGHFRVTIASSKFEGLRPLQKHRLVYDALGNMMKTDIHALSIHTVD
jgi:BolA protein